VRRRVAWLIQCIMMAGEYHDLYNNSLYITSILLLYFKIITSTLYIRLSIVYEF
jgi:hypothetical protein